MRRYPARCAINDPVSAWVYARAMMIKRIFTIVAAVAVSAAGTSLASAQGYPAGPAYSTAPAPYPPEYRGPPGAMDAMPDFDDQEDDQAPRGRRLNAGPLPGPVMSPDDPRYGRPAGAPVYSDRGPPQGPVMSPDDPRYGRPDGPPPVIYSDRGPRPAYSDRDDRDNRIPGAGIVYPNEDNRIRPPEGVGGPQGQYGSAPPATDRSERPIVNAALPVEEQPDAAPAQLAPNFRRQEVSFATKEPAGTIVVDTPNTYLYYVVGNGRAIRYGIRVGRDGFRWAGMQKITKKTEWPDWHPPTEMIERQPYLPRFMAGGEGNPLGARAMYLGSTVYRIHGTNQPSTIGKTVSSGCFGMLNDDVSDLYERVKVGTRVVVLPGNPGQGATTASTQPANPMAPESRAQAPQGQPAQAQASSGLPGTQPTVVPPLPAPVEVR